MFYGSRNSCGALSDGQSNAGFIWKHRTPERRDTSMAVRLWRLHVKLPNT